MESAPSIHLYGLSFARLALTFKNNYNYIANESCHLATMQSSTVFLLLFQIFTTMEVTKSSGGDITQAGC